MSTPDDEPNTSAGLDIPLVQVTPHISPLQAVPFPTGNSQEDLIQTSPGERYPNSILLESDRGELSKHMCKLTGPGVELETSIFAPEVICPVLVYRETPVLYGEIWLGGRRNPYPDDSCQPFRLAGEHLS
jgi:hypothetical protein